MRLHPVLQGFAAACLSRSAAWLLICLLAWCSPVLAQSNSGFDHDTTMFPLRGVHETVRCESCHIDSVFKGTPTNCSRCHSQGNRWVAVAMPDAHIPLSMGQECDACHTTSSFSGVKFTHATVMAGSCNTCHNGYYSTGKGPNHPATTQSCDACHGLTSFNNIGLPANHLPVGSTVPACNLCHNLPATGAVNFALADLGATHSLTIGETCQSCHSPAAVARAATAIGPGLSPKLTTAVNHIPVGALDCATSGCHQTYATSPSFHIGNAVLATPTLNVVGHASVAGAGQTACTTCHEAGTSYAGMLTSTTTVSDVRPLYDTAHPATGDCASCHTTTPTFTTNVTKLPASHIPTGSFGGNCADCHTAGSNYAVFDLVKTHQATGLTCTSCHNATTAGLADAQVAPIKTVASAPRPHIPVGTTSCASSGCHGTYTATGTTFVIGAGDAGNLASPVLNVAGHTSVAAATTTCSTCHAAGTNFSGMQESATVVSDVFPSFDTYHPSASAGDCSACHSTTPTFSTNVSMVPSTHIPTGSFGSNCASCHTTPGNYAVFDLVKTHQATGLSCTSCHNATTAALADAQVSPIKTVAGAPRPHIPVGTTNCASSGCHANYAATGTTFVIGAGDAGNLTSPVLNIAGHASVAAATSTCSTCHAAGTNFSGMQESATVVSDVFPSFDSYHPAASAGDCSACHTTTPTFASNISTVPPTHIPTGSFGSNCASCHTTAGNYAVFDLVVTHTATGVTCTSCHNATTAALADAQAQPIKTVASSTRTHIPVGTTNCSSSGCHTNYAATGNTFVIGAGDAGNLASPVLNVAGHSSVAAATASCSTCHAAGTNFSGMQTSSTVVSDLFPSFDSYHPAATTGDCSACHTTTPTFASNVSAVPPTHIPTGSFGSNCASCHTTAGTYAVFDLVVTHTATGVTCTSCHNATTAALADAQAQPIKTVASSTRTHIPVGTTNCSSSGCHTNYAATGNTFVIGAGDAGNLASPVLNVAGHTSVAAATASCSTCHAAGTNFSGMQTSSTVVSDLFPSFDSYHPAATTGDCSACHTTTPTFASNVSAVPSTHIPTGSFGSNCASCHTTAGTYTVFNLVTTHQATGVTCTSCHNATTAALADAQAQPIKTVASSTRTHIPVGTTNCASSGCHTNYAATGNTFVIGVGDVGSLASPVLNVTGHTSVAAATATCSTCHAAGTNFSGMQTSATVASDLFPSFDTYHPVATTGDCSACHTTTPTFASNISTVPPTHIPTGSAGANCASCHTTAGNYAIFDLTQTHTVTALGCVSCHNTVTAALQDAQAQPIKTQASVTHIPVGSLECTSSGCHGSYAGAGSTFVIGAGSAGNPANPTLTVTGHATVATAGVTTCSTCHSGSTAYAGMVVATSTLTTDVVPSAALDAYHVNYVGDCQSCHTTTPTFSANVIALPTGHMPTGTAGLTCATCHTTAGVYSSANLVATHGTGLTCLTCHATGAGPFINAGTAIKTPSGAANHIPFGSLDCVSCHSAYPATGTASFVIGVGAAGSITAPTLNVTAHASVSAAGVTTCGTCHNMNGTATYTGMVASQVGGGDQFPSATEDNQHQSYTGDCITCHTTTPTFRQNGSGTAKPAAHIPTGSAASCATCHTTAGNYAVQDLSATHSSTGQSCATCHNSTVAGALSAASPSIGTTIVFEASPGIFHVPFGTLDCVTCHGAYTGSATGGVTFAFANGGTAGNINNPSMTVALHSAVAAQVTTCASCHTASTTTPFTGMVASTNTVVGDQPPNATLDASHQSYTGDCAGCHTTTPTFHGNGVATPAGHIPIVGASGCSVCHTTSGVYTTHSTPAVHTATSQSCVTCHNTTVASAATTAFGTKEPTINTTATPSNHIPIGSLDCASSGCHQTYANSTVFTIGSGAAGNINAPTLTVAGHTTILNQSPTPACSTCHTGTAASPTGVLYTGMVQSSTAAAGDTFPPSGLDATHQSYTGDCGGCHTTTPTFSSNHSATAGLPTNHIPLSTFPSTPACTACHINPATYNVAQMNHTGLTGGCKTCHGVAGTPLVFANVTPTPQPTNHIPTTAGALANACENCHRNALTGVFTSFSGTVMDHTGVTTGCASCHAPGLSFYGVTMVTAPNATTDGHQYVATLTCESCHASTAIPGGFAAGKMVHAQVTATACMQCHEISGNPDYKLFTGANISFRRKSASHYYPGGTGGGPDCTTGCHQHSSTDTTIGTGTSAEPQAILSPATTVTLSSAATGTSVSKIVTLTNPGGSALAITSVAITGTGFSVTNGCGTSLASGTSCELTIQYLPTAAGSVSGTLTVTDNAGGTTGTKQTLAATGVVATTTLSANTVVALTSTAVGTASAAQAITFTNKATSSISIATAISGANAADFTATTSCGATVAASGTCTISVTFKPSATTATTAEEVAVLTITDGGLPASYTLQLLGSISSTSGNIANRAKIGLHSSRTGPAVIVNPGHGIAGAKPTTTVPLPGNVATALGLNQAGQSITARGGLAAGGRTLAMPADHAVATAGQCASCHNGQKASGLPHGHMLTVRSCDQCHNKLAWTPVAYQHLSSKYVQPMIPEACNVCHVTNTEAVLTRLPKASGRPRAGGTP